MTGSFVLDASALLAIFFREPGGTRAAQTIDGGSLHIIGAVNLAEIVMTSARRNPAGHPAVIAMLDSLQVEIALVDATLAYAAADAKVRYPILNLGDCFCYALAKQRNLPILTLDSDFAKTDAALVSLA